MDPLFRVFPPVQEATAKQTHSGAVLLLKRAGLGVDKVVNLEPHDVPLSSPTVDPEAVPAYIDNNSCMITILGLSRAPHGFRSEGEGSASDVQMATALAAQHLTTFCRSFSGNERFEEQVPPLEHINWRQSIAASMQWRSAGHFQHATSVNRALIALSSVFDGIPSHVLHRWADGTVAAAMVSLRCCVPWIFSYFCIV